MAVAIDKKALTDLARYLSKRTGQPYSFDPPPKTGSGGTTFRFEREDGVKPFSLTLRYDEDDDVFYGTASLVGERSVDFETYEEDLGDLTSFFRWVGAQKESRMPSIAAELRALLKS